MVPKSKVLLEQSDTSTAGGMASMTTCKGKTGYRLPVGGLDRHCAGRMHLHVATVQQSHLACAGLQATTACSEVCSAARMPMLA